MRLLATDPRLPDRRVLLEAGRIIRRGGLVAFPTETVYGLGANALDARAVERLYDAKQRDRSDPIIVHIALPQELGRLVIDPPAVAAALARDFWPGPLTLVLRRSDTVPPIVTAGSAWVGVRLPSHLIAQGIIRAAGVPVAAPSANLFTRTSATTAAHVLEDLASRIDLVIDGGPAPGGIESTVLQLEGDQARLLRPGAVTWERLNAWFAEHSTSTRLVGLPAMPGTSPGQAALHYAPRARLRLAQPAQLAAVAAGELADGWRVGVLAVGELPLPAEALVERLGDPADLATIGSRLFAALRALDAAGAQVIVAPEFAAEGLGWALRDRLRRAAGVGGDEA